MALFPWEKHTLNPGPQNRGTDEGLPPRGSRWPVEPGRRSEKTSEDGGNLPADAETQALGLELTVEEVVVGRIRLEDPRDDRPPSLQESLVRRMAGVEPMIEETLPLAGIGPEHPPIFEPGFVLVEQPSHTRIVDRRAVQGKDRAETRTSNQALHLGPSGMSTVAGLPAPQLRGKEIGGPGHDQLQLKWVLVTGSPAASVLIGPLPAAGRLDH